MILHCTKKLAAKLPAKSTLHSQEASPLGSWHAHLYTIDRRNVVLCCHDATRYTVFLAGLRKDDFANLGSLFKKAFLSSLVSIGVPNNQVRRAELSVGAIAFDTCTERSVLSTLTQMHFMVDAVVEEAADVMLLDPLSVTRLLSKSPVSVHGDKKLRIAPCVRIIVASE